MMQSPLDLIQTCHYAKNMNNPSISDGVTLDIQKEHLSWKLVKGKK